jgi:hypothetical protein
VRHFDRAGAVETRAELAELAKLNPARVTQIMNLLGLAPGHGTSRRKSSSCHP